MAGRGGYQAPSKPAAVSGPGALSQRTDGQAVRDITGADYGDAGEFRSLQQAAPLAKAGVSSPSGASAPIPEMTPFGAPSTMPGTPVTAGADAGAGPGTAALGFAQTPGEAMKQDAANLKPYLAALIRASQSDEATPEFRRFVRSVIAAP